MITNLTEAGRNLTKNASRLKGAIELSTAELSAFTGVSKRTLNRIEVARKARRTYRPSLATAVKLANFAGVSVDEFIQSTLNFEVVD